MDDASMGFRMMAVWRDSLVKRGLVGMMTMLAIALTLSGCGKSEKERQRDADNEAYYNARFRVLPPTAEHPHGEIERKINARVYRIPREYFYGRGDDRVAGPIMLTWPDMMPLPDPIRDHLSDGNLIEIKLDANNWDYQNPSDEQVEETIQRERNPPEQLKDFPELQEYRAKSGFTISRFRPVDPTVRRADGLRAYFWCGSILAGIQSPEESYPTQSCWFDFGWPDGVTMDLEFPRKHFKDWKLIHDRVMTWFESFRVLDVPTERLYPSYHDGQIDVPKPGQPAFRLE